MDKIFVLKKSKFITGPFSIDQLKEKGLKDTDKVWHEGLSDWKEAAILASLGITVTDTPAIETKAAKTGGFWKRSS